MKSLKPTVGALALAIAALFAGASPAAAAARTPDHATPDRYCTIVVSKAPKGQMSPVRSRACGEDPKAKALAPAAASTLLMEWFENANNSPSSLTRVYGDYGACDGDGYRLRAEGFWANRISGFNSYNQCNVATGYDLVNLSGDRQTYSSTAVCGCVLVGWVGSYMNDRIESFWIRQG